MSPWRLDAANAIVAPELLNRNNLSYHWVLTAPVRLETCLQAIKQLAERHEALRTSYPISPLTGEPHQSIQQEAEPAVEVLDRRHLLNRFGSLASYIDRTGDVPFELAERPPVRFTLIRDNELVQDVAFFVHHIVVDDWGVQFLWDDLTSILEMETRTRTLGTATRVEQPVDRARYESSAAGAERNIRSLRHWDATLERCPPTALPFSPMPFPEGENCTAEIKSHLLGPALARLSRLARAPESQLCLALTALLYTSFTRTRRCVVHCLVSNRFTAPPSVSCAFQILPVALNLSEVIDLEELLELTRRESKALLLHGRYNLIDRLELALRKQATTSHNLFHRIEFNYVVPSRNTSEPSREVVPEHRAAAQTPETRFRWELSQEDPLPDLFSVRVVNHKVDGVVEIRLGTNTAICDQQRCLELLTWFETTVLDLAESHDFDIGTKLGRLVEGIPLIETSADAEPMLYQGQPVDRTAIRRTLARAAPSATRTEVLLGRSHSGGDHLVACLAAELDGVTVQNLRRRLITAMEADPSFVMPDRFIVCPEPPDDPERLESWATAAGRSERGYDADGRAGSVQPPQTAAEMVLADAIRRLPGEATLDFALSYVECSGRLSRAGEIVRRVHEEGFSGITHLDFATLTPLTDIAAAMCHR
ncbi:condensation domain-containing protein [Spirillospora sp. NPDC048911]|uniref:condensation domain-containing protein n=1 Tax=Spirillospora sp. NPDC048911 TaxID=3364527 RepID=UPI0037131BB5